MNDNSKGVYYLANLKVESLPLYKTESSFANIFPDFLNTFSFFMFLKFWNSFFQVNEEFHLAKSGYLSLHHCNNLYMLGKAIYVRLKQNRFEIHSNTS